MNDLQKENHILKDRKLKKIKLSQINSGSMTESIFQSKKHSAKIEDGYQHKNQQKQFYSTFGTNMCGNWVRPESKK